MTDLRVSFPKPCDEPWEAMAPVGCDRICARCDKVIHDLDQYRFDEVEALLRRDPATCVRARIGSDGVVALKPGGRGRVLRVAVGVGVSAGLLSASAPAFAQRDPRTGTISGKVGDPNSFASRTSVVVELPDGRVRRGWVKDGAYRINHLPAGTYTLTFYPNCGSKWTVENVVVGRGEAVVADTRDPDGCIIIGHIRIEPPLG